MKEREHKIFVWHPQGDFGDDGEKRLLELLDRGWEIKASNTVNEGIYYVLYQLII